MRRKEAAFGLVHGLLAGRLTAAYTTLLSQSPGLAAVIVTAMAGNAFVAGWPAAQPRRRNAVPVRIQPRPVRSG